MMVQKLDFAIEQLEALETPWNWGDFAAGVGIGVGLVGIGVGVAVT